MKPSDKIKLKIESFDVNGYGVAKHDNKVVFVMGAMENEEVIAEIVNVHKKYAFAEVVEILTKSKDRIEPKCPYYEYCGGCDMMHMTYDCETKIKNNKVSQTLKSVVRKDFNVSKVVTNDKINGYRNIVMIPFTKDEEDGVLIQLPLTRLTPGFRNGDRGFLFWRWGGEFRSAERGTLPTAAKYPKRRWG